MRYRTHRQIIRAAVQSIAVHIPVCQFVWCSVVQLPTTKRPETVVTSAATFTSATIRLPNCFSVTVGRRSREFPSGPVTRQPNR